MTAHIATMCHCGCLEIYEVATGGNRLVVHMVVSRYPHANRKRIADKMALNEITHVSIANDVPPYVAMAIHGGEAEARKQRETYRVRFTTTY